MTAASLQLTAAGDPAGGDGVSTIGARSVAGAGGGKISVAGSFALAIVNHTATASLGGTAHLTGDATIGATSSLVTTVAALPAGVGVTSSGQLGIGASVALALVTHTTTASVTADGQLVGAHDLTLAASTTDASSAEARMGAKGGKVALAPAIAVTLATVTTSAFDRRRCADDALGCAGHHGHAARDSHHHRLGSGAGCRHRGRRRRARLDDRERRGDSIARPQRHRDRRGRVSMHRASRHPPRRQRRRRRARRRTAPTPATRRTPVAAPATASTSRSLTNATTPSTESTANGGAGAGSAAAPSASTSQGKVNAAAAVAITLATVHAEASLATGITVHVGRDAHDRECREHGCLVFSANGSASQGATATIGAAVAITLANITNRAVVPAGVTVSAHDLADHGGRRRRRCRHDVDIRCPGDLGRRRRQGLGRGSVALAVVNQATTARLDGTATLTGGVGERRRRIGGIHRRVRAARGRGRDIDRAARARGIRRSRAHHRHDRCARSATASR